MIAKMSTQVSQELNSAEHTNVLIIGAGKLGKQVANVIEQSPEANMKVCGFLDENKAWTLGDTPVLGSLESDIESIVRKYNISEVIVALNDVMDDDLSAKLDNLPVQVRVVPNYVNLGLFRPIETITDLPLLEAHRPAMGKWERRMKRAFDFTVAASVLLLIFPVFALLAIAIKLDSEGPVFFKQDRMGENGVKFKMFKFRSMVVNAEALQAKVNIVDEDGNTIHKTRNDPRVTRMGRFIRKTSLDELPQFINVLKGDMSLVGPRPELPWIVEQYQPWQRRRFDVPQGITGWWQINGRSDKPCHLNTEEDVYYIENYSFKLDIIILLKTVPALLKGKGAF